MTNYEKYSELKRQYELDLQTLRLSYEAEIRKIEHRFTYDELAERGWERSYFNGAHNCYEYKNGAAIILVHTGSVFGVIEKIRTYGAPYNDLIIDLESLDNYKNFKNS